MPSDLSTNIINTLLGFGKQLINPSTCYLDGITFTNNYVDTVAQGIVFAFDLGDQRCAQNFEFSNNIFLDVRSRFLFYLDGTNITLNGNTILNPGGSALIWLQPYNWTRFSFSFQGNIIDAGGNGISSEEPNIYDVITPEQFDWDVATNIVVLQAGRDKFPNGTIFLNSLDDVGFVDVDNRDYQLLPTSDYYVDNFGQQVGVDLCDLIQRIRLKISLSNCALSDTVLQPYEIIEVGNGIIIQGNLTMYPDSSLQVTAGNGNITITNCVTFDGRLNITDRAENETIVIASYACRSGEFNEVQMVPNETCLTRSVQLEYGPQVLTALITVVNTCESLDPNGSSEAAFPDWAIAVIVVGGAIIALAIFIVIAITVPACKTKVFPYAR